MSKESDDLDAGLQRDLQPAAPSAETPALGPEPVRSALPEPEAAEPLAAPPEPPTAEPRGPAPPSGAVRCAQCEADVVPTTPNHCPVCGGWVFDNTGSLVHGLRSKRLAKQVDQYRVDLIEQLFRERGGRDALSVVERIAVENYALNCAQAKTIEARLDQDGLFTQTGRRRNAFDMLKGISETIDRLRAALPPPITPPNQDTALAAMPMSALEAAKDLLERYETLTEFERGQLAVLLAASHGRVTLPPDAVEVPDLPAYRSQADAAIVEPGASSQPVSEPAPSQPAPEPPCRYCSSATPAACAALREQRPDVWAVLHGSDPAEIVRREREQREADEDTRQFLETGWPSARMSAKARAREPAMTDEQKRQAEKRRELGWAEGVLNETTGYRRRE